MAIQNSSVVSKQKFLYLYQLPSSVTPCGHQLMKIWLVESISQELCEQTRKCVDQWWMEAHSSATYYLCTRVLLSGFRICEPTRTLMSFVSTNNLMLVTFKSPQIQRLSGIRAYFEVIPEQSKSFPVEKSHPQKQLL